MAISWKSVSTKKQADQMKYGAHYRPREAGRCVADVIGKKRFSYGHQCSRSAGHGPGGFFCKQHGKIAAAFKESGR